MALLSGTSLLFCVANSCSRLPSRMPLAPIDNADCWALLQYSRRHRRQLTPSQAYLTIFVHIVRYATALIARGGGSHHDGFVTNCGSEVLQTEAGGSLMREGADVHRPLFAQQTKGRKDNVCRLCQQCRERATRIKSKGKPSTNGPLCYSRAATSSLTLHAVRSESNVLVQRSSQTTSFLALSRVQPARDTN